MEEDETPEKGSMKKSLQYAEEFTITVIKMLTVLRRKMNKERTSIKRKYKHKKGHRAGEYNN